MTAAWTVVQCDACGGAVAYDPNHALVRCLFCAAVALRPVPVDAPPEPPNAVVTFAIDADAAQAAFGRWVRRSWWRPKALHAAAASLQPVWIPTWRISAEVELHWAALVAAPTRSGRRPRTGVDSGCAEVLVPASGGVGQGEMSALRPFPATHRPWQQDDRAVPSELPCVSAAGALAIGHDLLLAERLRVVSRERSLSDAGGTAELHDVRTSLDALPLWIGSFRYRDRPWRVVVNGHSGKVVGAAPLDRVKIAIVTAVVLAIALLLARCDRDVPEPSVSGAVTRSR